MTETETETETETKTSTAAELNERRITCVGCQQQHTASTLIDQELRAGGETIDVALCEAGVRDLVDPNTVTRRTYR